ncbi:hypothetical protein C2L80_12785 [Rubneribacter badeniensis]|uniref:Uncharacterized protein n=1 Tax=Rubneribacter badeniensis TaxID=2070688 RepID=A0A2K2U1U2_9ACTN|nr:hypothetical protein [Rubneribacter badeniensis]OUO86761.1 hypothetical protein B5F41_13680 [Gordonibacter sp. An232A]PNV64283.1 hypothetical protein C2L80_12785 [Rubneribacter badeniensis]
MENESTEIQNASAERTAQDYIDAANKVIEIAEIAVSFIPGGAAATKAAKIATKAVPLARGAIKAAPAIAPVVSPFAKKAADAVAGKAPEALSAGAEKVAGAAKGAAATLGAAKDKAAGAVRSAADARAQERARKTARKTLLDGAGIRMSAETFLENWSTSDKLGVTPGGGYLGYSGCYAIATYDAAVKKDDYGTFRDIYVGKSSNMGASIHADVSGKGNHDVYADVKYKQKVHILLFPCPEDSLDQLEELLITALDADTSYNASK